WTGTTADARPPRAASRASVVALRRTGRARALDPARARQGSRDATDHGRARRAAQRHRRRRRSRRDLALRGLARASLIPARRERAAGGRSGRTPGSAARRVLKHARARTGRTPRGARAAKLAARADY